MLSKTIHMIAVCCSIDPICLPMKTSNCSITVMCQRDWKTPVNWKVESSSHIQTVSSPSAARHLVCSRCDTLICETVPMKTSVLQVALIAKHWQRWDSQLLLIQCARQCRFRRCRVENWWCPENDHKVLSSFIVTILKNPGFLPGVKASIRYDRTVVCSLPPLSRIDFPNSEFKLVILLTVQIQHCTNSFKPEFSTALCMTFHNRPQSFSL